MVIDIVTPQRKLIAGVEASDVRIPAAKGEIMVLPGHRELLSLLATGVLAFNDGGKERKFAISYGFVEARNDKITILAETAEESGEIDVERAKKAQNVAEEKLVGNLEGNQFVKFERKLHRALCRQSIGR